MLALVLSATEQVEPDKTGFYVMGFVLVIWAFALTFYGMRAGKWPEKQSIERLVITLSAVLVAGTMAAAILTS
jgi:hypothetical protein